MIRLKATDKVQIRRPEQLFQVVRKILLRQGKVRDCKEYFWVVGVKDNRIDFIELLQIGDLHKVQAEPRDVFRTAIVRGITSVVLVHNHASDKLDPSEEDIIYTKLLALGGSIIGVTVADHLIIDHIDYFSFLQNSVAIS